MTLDIGSTPRKALTPAEAAALRDRVLELLAYDPVTGGFTWRVSKGGWIIAGREAGSTDSHGHRQITIDGRAYLAHRLAWLIVHGVWPELDVDHRNGRGSDNKFRNLRSATRSLNGANAKLRHDNSSGFKGVSKHGRRWRAQIQVNKKKLLLGIFDTPEEAHQAYMDYAQTHFGEFARAK